MADLPTGTVTFLFSDIEGGATLAQCDPDALASLLAQYHAMLDQASVALNGHGFHFP
jgi:class 3 adenylate cyclase